MMKRLMSVLVAGAFLLIAPAVYGQDNPEQKKEDRTQADSGKQTLTGCLSEDAGAFKLATSTGEQFTVSGAADLAKHKDHTVKLTGTTSNEGGKMTMNVSKIEHVSPSCSK